MATDVCVKVDNLKELLDKYPVLSTILNSGYFRQYHLQDALLITSTEVDVLIATLTSDGIIKTTPFGYKMLKKVKDEINAKGVNI